MQVYGTGCITYIYIYRHQWLGHVHASTIHARPLYSPRFCILLWYSSHVSLGGSPLPSPPERLCMAGPPAKACHYKEESLQDKRQMTAIGKGSWLANTQLDLVQQTGITQILMPACPVANCSHYVYTNRLSAPLPAWGHHRPSAATHFASYWRLDNQII